MNPNNYQNQKERGWLRKYQYVMEKGGKCSICNYSKNLAALEFHHINPLEKDFSVDIRKFSNATIDKLREELEKCQLVCANCHREHHNPDLELDSLPEFLDALEVKRTDFNTITGRKCLVCGTSFKIITGRKYCSRKCRMSLHKNFSVDIIEESYSRLLSWEKVAIELGTTRRIIYRVRKAHQNKVK